jgi:TolB-like protein
VRRLLTCAAVVVLAATATSCGYRLAGANANPAIPSTLKVVAVVPFENQTKRPEIEQRVTEEVARELSKRGGYDVVTDRDAADALLEGAVIGFDTSPVQFNNQGRATRVETVVRLRATLRDVRSGNPLWSQDGLVFREQYDVPETEDDFFDRETLALDELARGAAGALVASIFEGF